MTAPETRRTRPDDRTRSPKNIAASDNASVAQDPWQLAPSARRELLESVSDDYVLGHELGATIAWGAGWAAGWDACEQDTARAWAGVAADVRDRSRIPSALELRRKRYQPDHQPCPMKCGRCSTCIHSRAWYANGRRDYTGGPVAWQAAS